MNRRRVLIVCSLFRWPQMPGFSSSSLLSWLSEFSLCLFLLLLNKHIHYITPRKKRCVCVICTACGLPNSLPFGLVWANCINLSIWSVIEWGFFSIFLTISARPALTSASQSINNVEGESAVYSNTFWVFFRRLGELFKAFAKVYRKEKQKNKKGNFLLPL